MTSGAAKRFLRGKSISRLLCFQCIAALYDIVDVIFPFKMLVESDAKYFEDVWGFKLMIIARDLNLSICYSMNAWKLSGGE